MLIFCEWDYFRFFLRPKFTQNAAAPLPKRSGDAIAEALDEPQPLCASSPFVSAGFLVSSAGLCGTRRSKPQASQTGSYLSSKLCPTEFTKPLS